MTEQMVEQIIHSLALNMPAEQIAVAMGVSVSDVNTIAITRPAAIIEERAFCESKGAIYG